MCNYKIMLINIKEPWCLFWLDHITGHLVTTFFSMQKLESNCVHSLKYRYNLVKYSVLHSEVMWCDLLRCNLVHVIIYKSIYEWLSLSKEIDNHLCPSKYTEFFLVENSSKTCQKLNEFWHNDSSSCVVAVTFLGATIPHDKNKKSILQCQKH